MILITENNGESFLINPDNICEVHEETPNRIKIYYQSGSATYALSLQEFLEQIKRK